MKTSIQQQQFEFELKLRSKFIKQGTCGSNLSHKVCDAWAGPALGERKGAGAKK